METKPMTEKRYLPAPWLTVLLALLPGLWVMAMRGIAPALAPLLEILGYLYMGLLVFGLPMIWRRERRFPAWALLPAGALVWFLVYLAGNTLHTLFAQYGETATWITLISLLLAGLIFATRINGPRMPAAFWLALGGMLLVNLLPALFFSRERAGSAGLVPGVLEFFMTSGLGPVEGLMLVAVGLLAARQHGTLALLLVIGGFGYIVGDSDYLAGYWMRDWQGLTAYLILASGLYLVVTPLAMLRATTRLGRALAVFLPAVVFHFARITVPMLAGQQPQNIPWGDVVLSLNVMLSLVLGWILYRAEEARSEGGA
jgi:hypothetical protein